MLSYFCKKTGQTVDIDESVIPPVAMAYLVRRGYREYFDNYHASETVKSHGGDTTKLRLAVEPLVIEARDRLLAGDVPGERPNAVDPLAAKIRELAAAQGMSADDWVAMVTAAPKKTKAA